jgi:hypothetical protein
VRSANSSVSQSSAGAVTGSEAWKQSGEQQKEAGIEEMKAASAGRDPQTQGFGKVEELAGKAAGCEGMEKEGAASKTE